MDFFESTFNKWYPWSILIAIDGIIVMMFYLIGARFAISEGVYQKKSDSSEEKRIFATIAKSVIIVLFPFAAYLILLRQQISFRYLFFAFPFLSFFGLRGARATIEKLERITGIKRSTWKLVLAGFFLLQVGLFFFESIFLRLY